MYLLKDNALIILNKSWGEFFIYQVIHVYLPSENI